MDGTIEKLKEKSKIRKAVFPLFQKLVDDIKESFNDAIGKIPVLPEPKAPVVNVAAPIVTVEPTPIEVKTEKVTVVENKIEFPDKQKVEVEDIKKLQKTMDAIEGKLDRLEPLTKLEVTNIPIVQFLDSKGKKQKALPVKAINPEFMVSQGPGINATNTDNRIWLREEFTYMTVSGVQVVTKVEKWDTNDKLTEDYEYDVNANPIIRSRRVEPLDGAAIGS